MHIHLRVCVCVQDFFVLYGDSDLQHNNLISLSAYVDS